MGDTYLANGKLSQNELNKDFENKSLDEKIKILKNKIAKVKRYNDFTYYKVLKEIENENYRRN